MSLITFLLAIAGIIFIHLFFAFAYGRLVKYFPFTFGGAAVEGNALYNNCNS